MGSCIIIIIIIIIIIMFLVTTDKQKSQYDYLMALETILLVRNGSRPLSGLTWPKGGGLHQKTLIYV